jgi:hypothetical protein
MGIRTMGIRTMGIRTMGIRTVDVIMKSSRYCNRPHQVIVTVGAAGAIDEVFEDDNVRSQSLTLHLGD